MLTAITALVKTMPLIIYSIKKVLQTFGYECNIQKSDIEKNMVYYSVKKEYVTVDGIDSVKYNVTLCYYQYYKSMKVYSDYYVQFKYEVIKLLGIKDIEKKMDTFFWGEI